MHRSDRRLCRVALVAPRRDVRRLPDWLVVLDLWQPGADFCTRTERDASALCAGLVTPPLLARAKRFSTVLEVEQSIPLAAWGPGRAEGVVLRRPDGIKCKVVRSDYLARPDQSWAEQMLHNELMGF